MRKHVIRHRNAEGDETYWTGEKCNFSPRLEDARRFDDAIHAVAAAKDLEAWITHPEGGTIGVMPIDPDLETEDFLAWLAVVHLRGESSTIWAWYTSRSSMPNRQYLALLTTNSRGGASGICVSSVIPLV